MLLGARARRHCGYGLRRRRCSSHLDCAEPGVARRTGQVHGRTLVEPARHRVRTDLDQRGRRAGLRGLECPAPGRESSPSFVDTAEGNDTIEFIGITVGRIEPAELLRRSARRDLPNQQARSASRRRQGRPVGNHSRRPRADCKGGGDACRHDRGRVERAGRGDKRRPHDLGDQRRLLPDHRGQYLHDQSGRHRHARRLLHSGGRRNSTSAR